MSRLVLISLLFLVCQWQWLAHAETSCEQKSFELLKKATKVKPPTFKTAPPLYELEVSVAHILSEMIGTCEVMKIKKIILSKNWKSLCSPKNHSLRSRCLREVVVKYNYDTPTSSILMATIATAIVQKNKKRWKNPQVPTLLMLDILLAVLENAEFRHFVIVKNRRRFNQKNPALKMTLASLRSTHRSFLEKTLGMIEPKLNGLKRAPAASPVTSQWIATMKRQIAGRLKKIRQKNGLAGKKHKNSF